MANKEIDVRGTTTAAPEQVWRLLGDSMTWPDWTPIETAQITERGGLDGVGEHRRFKTGRVTVHEEIVERREPQRLSYVLHGGLPLEDYRAEIDLSPSGDGTEIRWHTTFRGKIPGTGWLYRRTLDKFTRQFVDGLAAKAVER